MMIANEVTVTVCVLHNAHAIGFCVSFAYSRTPCSLLLRNLTHPLQPSVRFFSLILSFRDCKSIDLNHGWKKRFPFGKIEIGVIRLPAPRTSLSIKLSFPNDYCIPLNERAPHFLALIWCHHLKFVPLFSKFRQQKWYCRRHSISCNFERRPQSKRSMPSK